MPRLLFAHGSRVWASADAATTTYTETCTDVVTGETFQPKALRFYWMGLGSGTDAASEATHARRGVGFAVSPTARRCVAAQDEDAAATMVCTSGARNDAVAATVMSTPAFDGLLDLDALLSTGFRLIVDDAAPVDIAVFWEAWGGDGVLEAAVGDIAEPGATGPVSYQPGFPPSVVMLAGIQGTAAVNSAARSDSQLSVGFATGTPAAQNVVVVGSSDDASTASDTDGYCQTGECLAALTVGGGNPSGRATLSALIQDGFQLNWLARATTGRRSIYLAIAGGQWRAGAYTIAGNSAGATATVQDLPFRPIGVGLMGRMTVQDTAATATAQDRLGLGTASSPTARRSQGHLSENATVSSVAEVNLVVEYDQALAFPNASGALVSAYDIDAMTADGFRVVVDVAGGVASEWQGYLTFGGKSPTRLNNYQQVSAIGAAGMSVAEKIR